jgi:TolA-binding protein
MVLVLEAGESSMSARDSGHESAEMPQGHDPSTASTEAAYEAATANLRTALSRPIGETETNDFLRAARRQASRDDASVRRPRWPIVALPAAALAAAGLAVALWFLQRPVEGDLPEAVSVRLTEARDVDLQPAAAPDGALVANARITSGEAGTATLRDPTTAAVVVAAATQVRVARWSPGDAVLEIERGEVRATVEPRAPGEHFEIRTPYIVVQVVGTDFAVRHLPGEASVVRGFEGKVRVLTLDGRPLGVVGAGQTLRIDRPQASVDPPVSESPRVASTIDAPRPTSPVPPAAPMPVDTRRALVAPRPSPRLRPEAFPTPPAPALEAPRSAEPPSLGQPPVTEPEVKPEAAVPVSDDALVRRLRQRLVQGDEGGVLAELGSHTGGGWQVDALRGDALHLAGRPSEARAAYERAVQRAGDPPPERLLLDLAALVERQGAGDDAAATWRRYLAAYPDGRAAPRAHWRLAEIALRADRNAEAEERMRGLLDEFPASAEADAALVRLGRRLLDTERWALAAELFAAHTEARSASRAEAAVIGLVRAKVGLGRADEARALLEVYRARFPNGTRATEARHLAEALGG